MKKQQHMDRDSLLGRCQCGVCTCCTKVVLEQGINDCADKGDPADAIYLDSLNLTRLLQEIYYSN